MTRLIWGVALITLMACPLVAKIRVVATTTMVAAIAEGVGGDRIELKSLMGPGVDPHLYKATASDVATLQRADVIFYSGLHLEGRMATLFKKMGRRKKGVRAVTDALNRSHLLDPPEFKGQHDPHVWFDSKMWAACIDVVVRTLSEYDRASAKYYRQQGEALRQRYLELDQWTARRVAEVPPSKRILVTSHDAFNYFGKAYGFQVVAVQGISTVTEAGLADVANMVDFIRERQVRAIFVESSVSPATINRISEDSGAVVAGELFSDAMGARGEIETRNGESYDLGTYEGMIKHNVNAVVDALKL